MCPPFPASSPRPARLAAITAAARWIVALALVTTAWGKGAGELGRPLFREFPPGRYHLGFMCQALAQDRTGYVYLANYTIAESYDGTAWPRVALPTECAGIRDLALANDGAVYAGGASVIGRFQREGATVTFTSLADRLPPSRLGCDEIESVAAAGGTVGFADEEKLLLWRDGRFTVLPYPSPAGSGGARLHAVGETMYVSAPGRALCRLEGARLETVADDPVLRETRVIALDRGADGALVVLTDRRGFFTLSRGEVRPWPVEANRWLAGRTVWRARRLADGSYAVGFTAPSGDGGMIFDAAGRYVMPIDTTIGLYTPTIRSLLPDADGGLWIGSEVGLFRLEWPAPLTMFDQVNGLGSGSVNDLVRQAGTLYAATTEGVFRLHPSDSADHVARFERLLDRPALALASHPSGLLALVVGRVLQLGPGGFVTALDLPESSGVMRRSARDPDRVWLGTRGGLRSIRAEAGGWRDEGAVAGFTDDVSGLIEAGDGALWVTAADALFRIGWGPRGVPGDPRIERIGGDRGLPETLPGARLSEDAGQPVLVAEGASTLWRFEAASGRFVRSAATARLPVATEGGAWTAAEGASDDHAIWLAGSHGLWRVGPGPALQRWPHVVTAAAGTVRRMLREPGPAGDVLWIGGANGLVRLDVTVPPPAPAPFAAVIEEAGVADGGRLPPEPEPVRFTYRAMRHTWGDTVEYQTRLVGLDAAWSAWSAETERVLSRLAAGAYQFEVRARDADGVVSAPATRTFTVLRPWWLTGWAIAGYVGAAAALFGGLVRLRTRALHRRAARLERLVVERTHELAGKNAELTRQHRLELDAKISAQLGEEKARLEVLRYQLNPHFLFNALATISGLVLRQPAAARSVARQLAEFCRLTLTRGRHEDVTLAEEFQMLTSYLDVVRAGAEEPPTVTFTLDPAAEARKIPAFLLLPLVENAWKYGRGTATTPLQIAVSARLEREGAALEIEVANTGEWLGEEVAHGDRPSTRIGLDNIRQRLARTHPGRHAFTIAAGEGWVRARVRLGAQPDAAAE